jgi:hypothetical protein
MRRGQRVRAGRICPGAPQDTLHRSVARLEHLRDLCRSETEYVAQHEHRPVVAAAAAGGGHKRQRDRLVAAGASAGTVDELADACSSPARARKSVRSATTASLA